MSCLRGITNIPRCVICLIYIESLKSVSKNLVVMINRDTFSYRLEILQTLYFSFHSPHLFCSPFYLFDASGVLSDASNSNHARGTVIFKK